MTNPSVQSEHAQTLEKLFRGKSVARLAELERALDSSGRTVFRALGGMGYLTSYSHAGKYYTLRRIPKFDTHGLWLHGEVLFSSHGTLRATVVVLVKQAPAGHTHEELQALLKLRVHDTLRSLIADRALGRELFMGVYVYLHPDRKIASTQMEARRATADPPDGARSQSPLDLARVVDVLIAVIQTRGADATAIAARLRSCGLAVSDEQVEAVFTTYGLKKTPRSRSKPSRR